MLSEQHTKLAPVLQVALHQATPDHLVEWEPYHGWDGFETTDLHSFIAQQLQTSQSLLSMLFEYFGQHIAQPRRDLFEKVTGLKPGQHSTTGFLTGIESLAAAELARQQEFL